MIIKYLDGRIIDIKDKEDGTRLVLDQMPNGTTRSLRFKDGVISDGTGADVTQKTVGWLPFLKASLEEIRKWSAASGLVEAVEDESPSPAAEPAVSELVPVRDDPSGFSVNARQLHAYLGVGKVFATWITDRIENPGFVENEDFIVCFPNSGSKECGVESKGRGGRNVKEYWLTLDMAKELGMLERTERGRAARRYFIACEKELRKQTQSVHRLPATYAEALRELANSAEENERLKLENASTAEALHIETEARQEAETRVDEEARANAQLVALLDRPRKLVTLYSFFPETQSLLGLTSKVGYELLRSMGILRKEEENQWGLDETMPTSKYMQMGYFHITRPLVKLPEVEGKTKTGNYIEVERRTPNLTADVHDSEGNVIKEGGYSWLLRLLYNDPRALLYRLYQRHGVFGHKNPLHSLYGCRVVYVRNPELTPDAKFSPAIIRCYRPVKARKEYQFLLARQLGEYQYRGAGITMEAALRELAANSPFRACCKERAEVGESEFDKV